MKLLSMTLVIFMLSAFTNVFAYNPQKQNSKSKGKLSLSMPGKAKMIQNLGPNAFIFKCKGNNGICWEIWDENSGSGEEMWKLRINWRDGTNGVWVIAEPGSVIPVGNGPDGDAMYEAHVLELLEGGAPPVE